jgi:hypothetical protein
MNAAVLLEEAVALALKLAPRERLQLIERVAASVKHELEAVTVDPGQSGEHWGQNLVRLLDETGPVELIHPEIEDATEWVRQIRRDQESQRGLNWDDAE